MSDSLSQVSLLQASETNTAAQLHFKLWSLNSLVLTVHAQVVKLIQSKSALYMAASPILFPPHSGRFFFFLVVHRVSFMAEALDLKALRDIY